MEVLEHIGSGEGSRCIVAALLTDAPEGLLLEAGVCTGGGIPTLLVVEKVTMMQLDFLKISL